MRVAKSFFSHDPSNELSHLAHVFRKLFSLVGAMFYVCFVVCLYVFILDVCCVRTGVACLFRRSQSRFQASRSIHEQQSFSCSRHKA
jgi:hypothetical protein